ncbi:MAG: hypothetical protein IIY54_10755 [Ruminococcus sp.]|nr:hypothetical protein [Ruminococcus sp.]
MLGKYIMIAVNDPKKYPREPASQSAAPETGDGQMTEEDQAKLNAMMEAFARRAESLPTVTTEDETAKEKEPECRK